MPQNTEKQHIDSFEFFFRLKALATAKDWAGLRLVLEETAPQPILFHDCSRQAFLDVLTGMQADLAQTFVARGFCFDSDDARREFAEIFLDGRFDRALLGHIFNDDKTATAEAFARTMTLFLDLCLPDPVERAEKMVKALPVPHGRDFLRLGISLGDPLHFVSLCLAQSRYALLVEVLAGGLSPASPEVQAQIWPLAATARPLQDAMMGWTISDFPDRYRKAVAEDDTVKKALQYFERIKQQEGPLAKAAFLNLYAVDRFGLPVSVADALIAAGRAGEIFEGRLAARWLDNLPEAEALAKELKQRPGVTQIHFDTIVRERRARARQSRPKIVLRPWRKPGG